MGFCVVFFNVHYEERLQGLFQFIIQLIDVITEILIYERKFLACIEV